MLHLRWLTFLCGYILWGKGRRYPLHPNLRATLHWISELKGLLLWLKHLCLNNLRRSLQDNQVLLNMLWIRHNHLLLQLNIWGLHGNHQELKWSFLVLE